MNKDKKRNLVTDLRLERGLTQKEFSELFLPPIPLDTIKSWDSGRTSPPNWVTGLIFEYLERTIEEH